MRQIDLQTKTSYTNSFISEIEVQANFVYTALNFGMLTSKSQTCTFLRKVLKEYMFEDGFM